MIDMDEKGVIEAIQAQQLKASKDSYQLQKAEKGVVKKRLAELEKLIQSLYENKVIGEVSPDIYAKLMPKYEAEMKQKEARLAEIETELSTVQEVTTSAEEWVALMKRYRDVSELSRELLANLIEKIEIGEAVVVDGQKQREIRIHYKFVGYIGWKNCPTLSVCLFRPLRPGRLRRQARLPGGGLLPGARHHPGRCEGRAAPALAAGSRMIFLLAIRAEKGYNQ